MKDKKLLTIIDVLKSNFGYSQYDMCDSRYEYSTLLEKVIENDAVCEHNNKLCIHIKVTVLRYGDFKNESFNIEITAKKNGEWWKLSCYSPQTNNVLLNIHEIENKLIKMFNCL